MRLIGTKFKNTEKERKQEGWFLVQIFNGLRHKTTDEQNQNGVNFLFKSTLIYAQVKVMV